MGSDPHLPLVLPPADTFPPRDASLEQVVRFASSVDPTMHFRTRWGEHYNANVAALWRRCVESYLAGNVATSPAAELLMCLAYDMILGPHLGVPDHHKLPFLRWLIEGARPGFS